MPRGVGAPPYLVAYSMLPWLALQVPGIASVPKIRFPKVSFRLDDIPFLRNTEIGKKTTIWAGPTVNRLVPKII